ncbi:Ribosomal RNA-processing protein 17 [Pseudozyma hubeiensis]|nr:Ribosomal RNA-processing protein 17 [Pseudozyma hubeiensis]
MGGKGPELVFDDKARAEYLTGFRKRKQERKQAGRDYLAKKAKEEQLVARKELRDARKEKAAENVREQRKAFGLEAEGESDLDAAVDSDDDQQLDGEDAVPQIQGEEYDSDEHHTHVVVESFDPEQEAFEKATAVASSSAPRKPKPNGQAEETGDPHKEENVSHKRLHISGLTASFSKEDLERRFSTFGTVVALDGLGKRDALGQFRPYAYLTLQAPPQQIQRCMNLLSGSVWKGATLRIGEAKPDFQRRIQLENDKRKREEDEKASNQKKPKRLPPGMAFESSHMDPVDQHLVENGLAWGWKRTPAGHLVRPLRMRPTHPLPKPSRASTLSRANPIEDEEDEEEDQPSSSSRRARVNPRPPTKAHRITIDPTRYGAVHLSGPLLESLAAETGSSTEAFDASSLGPGEWRCEEIDDGEDALASDEKDHRLVRWQYTAKDGKVLHEEFTKIPVRVVSRKSTASTALDDGVADDVVAQLDFDQFSNAGSDDDLFSGFTSSLAPAQKPSEPQEHTRPFASNAHNMVDSTDIDDLFAGLPASGIADTNVDDLFSDLPSIPTPASQSKRAKADKDVVATPTSAKKIKGSFVPGLDPEEDDPANFSDGYDEVAAAGPVSAIKQAGDAEEERKKTLALLGEMFGSGSDDEASTEDVVEDKEAPLEDVLESEVSASSEAESSSDLDGEPEIDEVPSSSEPSSSSASEADGDEMPVEEEAPAAVQVDDEAEVEEEQDVPMADEPEPVVEAAAAGAVPLDAKSRRAAFLSSLSESSPQIGSFVPIARFDPGTRPAAAAIDTDASAAEASQPAPIAIARPTQTPTIVQASKDGDAGTKVSMSTLKEMFRPQDRPSASAVTAGFSLGLGADGTTGDGGGGFSLMDSLGLEFELEEEQEEAEPHVESFPAASHWSHTGYSRFQPAPATVTTEQQEQPKRLGPFFPSSSNSASWNGADSQGSVQRWLKPRSQEERETDWAKYKESLTQVIKKRHREAARKHKRNFKSMSQPQQNPSGVAAGSSSRG